MSDARTLVLELLTETLDEWRQIVARDPLGRFDARGMTKPWVAGLKSAGLDARQAKEGRAGNWAALPFVIEFSCPFGHRTIDRQRIGLVRLIVEDDGWVSMARGDAGPENEPPPRTSPFCWQCQPDALAEWLLTCPRCVAGEDGDEHREGHSLWETGSSAPFTFVLYEFDRAMHFAEATWVLDHKDQAVDDFLSGFPELDLSLAGIEFEPDEDGNVPRDVAQRWVLDQVAEWVPKPSSSRKAVTSGAPRPAWTDAEVVAFLEKAGVPADATVRAAWAIVGPMPQPRPSKSRVEEVQPLRRAS